jgi:hypothetical protein
MRAVARAEPAVVIAGAVDGHTSQVRTDAKEHERLLLDHSVRVGLRVAQLAKVDLVRRRNLLLCEGFGFGFGFGLGLGFGFGLG